MKQECPMFLPAPFLAGRHAVWPSRSRPWLNSLSLQHTRENLRYTSWRCRGQDILSYTRCILNCCTENRTGLTTTKKMLRLFKCIEGVAAEVTSKAGDWILINMQALGCHPRFLAKALLWERTGFWGDCFGHSRPPNCIQHCASCGDAAGETNVYWCLLPPGGADAC